MKILYIAYSAKQAYEFLREIGNKLPIDQTRILCKKELILTTDNLVIQAVSIDSSLASLIGYPQPDYVCNCGYPNKYVSNKHYEYVEQKIKHIKTRFQESVKYITEQELKELIGVV